MVRNNTVIVLGAGASRDVNLPTGAELKVEIAKLLDFYFPPTGGIARGDGLIADTLEGLDGGAGPYVRAAWHIRDALPLAKSIDDFLEVQKKDDRIALCAKLAIVRAVLKAEAQSTLYVNHQRGELTLDFVALDNTWFTKLVRVLTESCSIDNLPNRLRSIAFIVFNYDRCLEHFLLHAFQTLYSIGQDEAARLVNDIEIYHPYGTVGHLPWQRRDSAIDFGSDELDSDRLMELAAQIKTFSEGVHASSDIAKIKQKLKDGDMLIFLGFAFHRINVELLEPESPGMGHTRVFATALHVSDSDRAVIKSALARFGISGNAVALADMKCSDLFDEYQRTFALE